VHACSDRSSPRGTLILVGLVRRAPEVLVVVLVGGIVVMLVFAFAYSYRVWQADPAKRQA
jgi:hypothetical protein